MASPYDNVDPAFGAKVRQMVAESQGKITIVSGYRSPERQQQLWGEALRRYGSAEEARKWVAPPGKSNHNKGVAFDLGGDIELAHILAPKYGLHFPMGHEPWHIEPADLQSSPDAYTQDPAGTTDPKHEAVFNALGGVLGEMLTPSAGVADTTSTGEASTANLAAGVTPSAESTTESPTMPTGSSMTPSMGNNGTDVDAFMAAISGQESGGDPNAVNATSGAQGEFQIMPSNWGPWSKEAGLGANAPRTPENQRAVARFKMQQYYDQFGSWDKVAKAWYSGPANVDKNVGGGPGYPDSNTYAQQVVSRMGAN